jgi:hypothetical protein
MSVEEVGDDREEEGGDDDHSLGAVGKRHCEKAKDGRRELGGWKTAEKS